jgi:hypothetical protein
VPLIELPFKGEKTELLSEMIEAVDDEDLKRIAGLDYGMDFDDHLTKLRRIKRYGLEGFILDAYLVEVLDLCGWSEPTHEAARTRIHRQRAFSCALAYGAGDKPSNRFYTSEWKLIQFVESLIELCVPPPGIIRFFSWVLSDAEEGDSEIVFIGVVLLHFGLQEKRCSNDGILALLDWIMMMGDAADMNDADRRSARGWCFSVGRGRIILKWQVLIENLSGKVQTRHGPSIDTGVALLVSMMLPAVNELA